MPAYCYRCPDCGPAEIFASIRLGPPVAPPCPRCGRSMGRSWRTEGRRQGLRIFSAHFNNAVGAYVSSERQFRSLLRRRGQEQEDATGIVHSYVPFDGTAEDAGMNLDQLAERRAIRDARWGKPPERKVVVEP